METIVDAVKTSVNNLMQSVAFKKWVSSVHLENGDLILINNSFLHRDKSKIKTTKNPQFLCIVNDGEGFYIKDICIAIPPSDFDLDYKLISHKSGNLPELTPLDQAIEQELEHIGKLVFILIGLIDNSELFIERIEKEEFDKVILDYRLETSIKVDGRSIFIKDPSDEDHLWDLLKKHAEENDDIASPLPDNLEDPFKKAIKILRNIGHLVLTLPTPGTEMIGTLLDLMALAIHNQIEEYQVSLDRCGDDLSKDQREFNNILRIAYNFASDAGTLLKLLISVFDLKPLILWMTIDEQITLAQSFSSIPGISQKKPSLNDYVTIINGARNRTFHDLFPFQHTIEAQLDGVSLAAKQLRIFSPYKPSSRPKNEFDYEDKQLVEILTEFTRAEEKYVQPAFWKKNIDVMTSTVILLEAVSTSLKHLSEETL